MTIDAISGWTEPGNAPGLGEDTKNVLVLAKTLGFNRPPHNGDFRDVSGSLIDGTYYACHAELKVAV
jgi:hypothetical protein